MQANKRRIVIPSGIQTLQYRTVSPSYQAQSSQQSADDPLRQPADSQRSTPGAPGATVEIAQSPLLPRPHPSPGTLPPEALLPIANDSHGVPLTDKSKRVRVSHRLLAVPKRDDHRTSVNAIRNTDYWLLRHFLRGKGEGKARQGGGTWPSHCGRHTSGGISPDCMANFTRPATS